MDRRKLLGGGLVFLLVILVAGFVVFSVQGSFFQDVGCEFEDVENPETEEKYSGSLEEAVEDYRSDFVPYAVENSELNESQAEDLFDRRNYRMQDGNLQVKDPQLTCGSNTGSGSQ